MRMLLLSIILSATLLLTGASQIQTVFPLRISADHGNFEDANGHPFLLNGEAAWSLIAELRREEVDTYLTDRHRRGFNAILVNLIEHRFSSNPPANAYGDRPFMKEPFGQIGEKYFDHAAWIVEEAHKHQMAVFLVPAYFGVNGGGEGWFKQAEVAGPDQMKAYGEAVARRFLKFSNIVWVLGGDFDAPDQTLVSKLAEGISSVSPHALQTVHSGRDTSTIGLWGKEDWLAFDTVYTYGDVHNTILERSQTGKMPVIFLEGAYEYERDTTASMIRRNAYGAILGGAAGQFFGVNPIWHFSGPGVFSSDKSWQEALNSPGAQSMSVLKALVDAIPWSRLQPDRDRSITENGDSYASTLPDKSLSVIYGDAGHFQIKKSGVIQTNSALWIDPTSGKSFAASPPEENGEILMYTAPNRQNSPSRDWLLLIGNAEWLRVLRKD
jgi:hypothetical protein